jgi:peptide deformylase
VDAEDMEAVVLQHEIDHLNGLLILDKASRLKRQLYKRKCERRIKT